MELNATQLLGSLRGEVLLKDRGARQNCTLQQPSIPRQVFLTTRDKDYMMHWERENLAKCERVNPGWTFHLFGDSEIHSYVKETFPELLGVWSYLKNTIEQKDLWSYLIVYDRGGLFIDTDIDCRRPMDELIDEGKTRGLIGVEKADQSYLQFAQWSFAFAPRHTIPLLTINKIRAQVEEIKAAGSSDKDAVFLTGPVVWTDAILEYMYTFGMGKKTIIEGHSFQPPRDHQVGDVRLLNVNAFAPMQPHSSATCNCSHPDIYLIHQWSGRWKNPQYRWYTADGKPPIGKTLPVNAMRGDWRPVCFTE
ncbi:unnamed protein product [Vitrella brassicaformis CCMP3155]|uniref:Alpha 1,4-glycosyltransferase domain-containing protein n=1 Tax=Vitrella brassicaformis (strain CCMP3155) TaxID=1169540 RepID=A0A0G4H8B1_VITBC|nr:unnamed protein product [Vitrella brassicaformis CCMP3155]|eukprot:CEM40147.1 unnamed protein product [Vitrella brassicaformis CCMP3155]